MNSQDGSICKVLEEFSFLLLKCEIISERDIGKSQPPRRHGDDDGVFVGIILHKIRDKENM